MEKETFIVLDISVEEKDACLLAILTVGNFEEEEPNFIVMATLRKKAFEIASDCCFKTCLVE